MKVIIHALLIMTASAMTSGVSSSRKQNPSNINKRSYNVRLRGLEKRLGEHTSARTKAVAKESAASPKSAAKEEEKNGETPAKEDRKMKKKKRKKAKVEEEKEEEKDSVTTAKEDRKKKKNELNNEMAESDSVRKYPVSDYTSQGAATVDGWVPTLLSKETTTSKPRSPSLAPSSMYSLTLAPSLAPTKLAPTSLAITSAPVSPPTLLAPTSLAPTSLAPTSLAPTLLAPTSTPTSAPTSLTIMTKPPATLSPSLKVDSAQATDVIPPCPPAYDITKTNYVSGELVTVTDSIFECNPLYVVFCNIGEWDDALLAQDANAMKMWDDAWVHVGPCSVLADVPEPKSSPTLSPILSPSGVVGSAQAADVIPPCPPAYDITKTDYVSGELVAITENIFECNSLYVVFCNIGEWDEALLAQDANAEEMWSDAWVHVGPCSVLADVPEPKSSPTLSPIMSPSEVFDSEKGSDATSAPPLGGGSAQDTDAIPGCPPAYDITKKDYVGGDLVTMTDNIFECHSPLFCNIGEWDDALLDQDADAMEMWSDAWVHVGPCTVSAAAVPEPTSLPTFSPTLAPSEISIPACPPAYNITKTDYLGGDIATVDENIFECDSLYVEYCNIGEWDDAYLAQDDNAEEMWNDAWVYVGPCG
jgi:hypothetical protein